MFRSPRLPAGPAASRSLLAAAVLALASFSAIAQEPRYVDVSAYPLSDEHYDAWIGLRIGLKQDFDYICGDTFCEGEFTNIESLRFNCSVERATGRIGMCGWVFAASNEEIAPLTGRIRVTDRGFWHCRMPVVGGTSIEQFIEALQVDEPLYAPLPMTTDTLMDGLIDCL